jgi:excisionase family DNA binding protein
MQVTDVQNKVMTTGQVARVFSVNINTVIKWFDEGKLAGFRLPRSNERRIYRESVLSFMKEHGIANELLQTYEDNQKVRRRGRKPGSTAAALAQAAAAASGPELRIFPRKPVELSARIQGGLEAEDTPVMVRNLSLGGAFVTGFNPARRLIPEEFRLIVDGTDGAPHLDTTCEVVHVRRTENNGLTLGCRFTRVDPRTLQSYLATI